MSSTSSVYSPPISSIQASSTAAARSTYIPPFATTATFVATSATTHSLPSGSFPIPTVTGFPANPTTPAFLDDLNWVSAYLLIHSLSQNSYVYAYIFWFAVAFIFALLSLLHNAGARGGVLGAWWSKWALRRRTWRKSVSQTAHRQPWSLPSNAQLLSLVALSLAVAALCVAGPNYLNPTAGLFNFSVPQKDSISKRDNFDPSVVQFFRAQYTIPKSLWSSAARAGEVAVMLLPLTVLLALKAPPFAIFAIPYTAQLHFDKLVRLHRWAGRLVFLVVLAHVVMWCIELGRNKRPSTGELVWDYVFLYNKFIFGWVAFASLTILTLLSLRPIRNLRYPLFYNSHIFLTPIVLVFTALHHPPVWWWAWAALFIWVGERLWRATFWIYVNGLWGINDSKKWIPPPSPAHGVTARDSRISVAEKRANSSLGFKNKHDSTSTGQESFEMSPISPTPRRVPASNSLMPPSDAHTTAASLNPAGRASFGFWDPHYLDRDGTHTPSYSIDSIAYDGDDRGGAGTPISFNSKTALAGLAGGPAPSPSPAPGVGTIARNATTYAAQVPVPPGFAHATLLPGRTVRLRILPGGAFSWAPGQHVLVGVPAVSKFSTHPFSIASVCDELSVASEADAYAAEKGDGRKGVNQVLVSHNGLELVILVRAKKGWTRRLWNLIEDMQARGERVLPSEHSQLPSGYTLPPVDRRASGGINATGGVLLRSLIDGPFGSTARTRWGDYSSVLIVAGGSGVSYGISILEYYCLCMSGRDGRYLGTRISGSPWAKGGWKTERVRFIWLVREYSHIQWCASSLRRCLALLPSGNSLEVNIFVTHYKPPREIRHSTPAHPGVAQLAAEEGINNDLLLPPAPHFAQKSRRERPTSSASSLMSDSESSIGSEDSDNSYADLDYHFDNFGDHRPDGEAEHKEDSHDGHDSGLGHEEHVLDYTNFDGDDDEPLPGESHLSRKLKKEGKLRRQKTKKTLKARLAKKALDVRSSLAFNSSKLPSGAHTPMPRPSSSVTIEVYPETPKRASAMSSDPLLAASSTSPPISPTGDGEHDGHFAAMQSLAPSRLSTTPSSRLSIAGDETPHGMQRPPLSVRPVSGLSTLSAASSIEMRSPIDRDGRWLDLQEGKLAINPQELQDIRIISEVAHPGKPKLERILQNEVEDSKGRLAVCCCGPTSLNALMRKYVAAQISPSKILKGDMRGSIDFITEDFEY